MRTIEDNAFLLLTIAVSLAFAWILLPFYGAVSGEPSQQYYFLRCTGDC